MKKNIITIILLVFTTSIMAQNGKIKGKITDAYNHEPISFATVIVEETQIYTTSDEEGNFILTGLTPGYVKIRVTFMGYLPTLSEDVLVSNNKTPYVEIEMKPSDYKINEVLVTVDPFQKEQEAEKIYFYTS